MYVQYPNVFFSFSARSRYKELYTKVPFNTLMRAVLQQAFTIMAKVSCFPHFPCVCCCHGGCHPNSMQDEDKSSMYSDSGHSSRKRTHTHNLVKIDWERRHQAYKHFSSQLIQFNAKEKELALKCISSMDNVFCLVQRIKLLYDVINSIGELCTK